MSAGGGKRTLRDRPIRHIVLVVKNVTKLLIGLCVFVSLPVFYVLNGWTSDPWYPWELNRGEDASYYVAWALANGFVCVPPALLCLRVAAYLYRRVRQPKKE